MKTLLTTFLFCLACQLSAQDATKLFVLLGIETGGTVLNAVDPGTGEEYHLTNLRFGPHIGYYLHPQWILGVLGEYEIVKSNFVEADPL